MTKRPATRASSIGRARMPARRRARGFTLIEMLAALAIAAVMIAGLAAMIGSSLDDTRAQQAALYQARIAAAARQLVEANYADLAQKAAGGSFAIALNTGSPYQLASYLSGTTGATNSYGQAPCLLINSVAGQTGTIQALLVTEGGRTIPDGELGYIAANAGQGGGAIQAMTKPAGAAIGAYGGWQVNAPNPGNVKCTTPTGVGHLATLITTTSTQVQNTDYLYRVAVPGNTDVNTMHVPLVLATTQSDFAQCTERGAIAADAAGNVLNCDNGPDTSFTYQWLPQASYHWQQPVADETHLASTYTSPHDGDVAMTLKTNRAYTYSAAKGKWEALAVDESGHLTLGNSANAGDACTNPDANSTQLTTDSTGDVLSCQPVTDSSGATSTRWEMTTAIVPGPSSSGCTLVVATPNAVDYPTCGSPAGGSITGPNNGTYSYKIDIPVTLNKPGVIAVSSWGHMNDGICVTDTQPTRSAQLSQDLDILDSSKTSISHTESQTPTLTNDSGGINNTLTQSEPKGNYYVEVTTNWAAYVGLGDGRSWTSSYCYPAGNPIPNTPVAAGWTINLYY